jgi:outer membrane protein assembly factor BamB
VNRRPWVIVSCLLMLGAALSPDVSAAGPAPRNVLAPGSGDWPQFRQGAAHTGYNPTETAISSSNVADLRLAWTGPTGDAIYSAPAVADGVVYVGSENGTLYAFAVGCNTAGRTCTPLWTATTGNAIDSSPAVADGVVYVGSADGRLYAFAVGCNTGGGACTPLWKGTTGGNIVSSPAVADGVVYVGSEDWDLYAFAVGCGSGGGICAPLWTASTGGEIDSSPAVADGVVYVGSDDHVLYAFAVGCGSGGGICAPLWRGAMTEGEIHSSPAVSGGVVYIGSTDGDLYAFAVGCNAEGRVCPPLWTATAGEYIDASPAVAGGVVYIVSGTSLYAFAVGCNTGGRNCAPLWTGYTGGTGIGEWLDSSPVVANGVVYAGLGGRRLYAFAVGCSAGNGTCTPLWTAATGGWDDDVASAPAVSNGGVYVGTTDGLYAFDLLHGDATRPKITSAPRVAGRVPSTLGSGSTLVTWAGTDGAGSGIVAYDLQEQKDGGAWKTVASTEATSISRALSLGHRYRYQVRARDRAGNVGTWSAGAAVVPAVVENGSPAVTYPSGAWHTQVVRGPSGGATRWSTSTGARSRFTFTGRAVAWVTSTGPSRGKVKVYVDGAYRATVDLHAGGVHWKQVRFSASWASRGSHTLELRSALAGHRVDVDAFVVYR